MDRPSRAGLGEGISGLEQARNQGGFADLVERGQEEMARAVDLATQQFDRTRIPRDPIPARMDEARRIVNKLLKELADARLLSR